MASSAVRTINRTTGVSSRGARKRASNNIKRQTRNKYRRKTNGGAGG